MNWRAPVDLYCERVDTGLLAEPLNAASNLSFILAGLWLLLQLSGDRRRSLILLSALIVLIGLCSAAFHLWGELWAEWLDIGSIALFIHLYVACFARHSLGLKWSLAWLAAPVFAFFSWAVLSVLPAAALNGSVAYAPALIGLLGLSLWLAWLGRSGASLLAISAVLFCVSITFRSVDNAWCDAWPHGTHWVWHLLNGLVLALATKALARSGREVGDQ